MRAFLATGIALLWACSLAASATADDEGPPSDASRPEGLFAQLDANGDGQVAEEEITEDHRRLFKRLVRHGDGNQDGRLSADEFAQALAENPDQPDAARPERDERMARGGDKRPKGDGPRRRNMPPVAVRPRGHVGPNPLLRALDTDGDGEVSGDELSAAGESLKKLDHNGDGRLDRMEVAPPPDLWRKGAGLDGPRREGPPPWQDRPNPEEPRRERRPPGDPPQGAGDRPQRERGPGEDRPAAQFFERMMEADEDGDGKISRDEAPERVRRAFERFDVDGDGYLNAREIRRHAERMRDRLQERRPEGRPRGPRPRPGDAPKPRGDEGPPEADAPDKPADDLPEKPSPADA